MMVRDVRLLHALRADAGPHELDRDDQPRGLGESSLERIRVGGTIGWIAAGLDAGNGWRYDLPESDVLPAMAGDMLLLAAIISDRDGTAFLYFSRTRRLAEEGRQPLGVPRVTEDAQGSEGLLRSSSCITLCRRHRAAVLLRAHRAFSGIGGGSASRATSVSAVDDDRARPPRSS